MKVLLAVCLVIALAGCATAPPTPEQEGRIAYAGGKLAVYAASKAGVNNLEFEAILPAIHDARQLLAAAPADRPAVLAGILDERLALLTAGWDPVDAAFARAALMDFLQAAGAAGYTTVEGEHAARIVERFAAGVEEGILIVLGRYPPEAPPGEEEGPPSPAAG